MVDTMNVSLANGNIVRMGELGSLRVSLRSSREETPEDVNTTTIKNAKVTFKPGMHIRELLGALKYVKE